MKIAGRPVYQSLYVGNHNISDSFRPFEAGEPCKIVNSFCYSLDLHNYVREKGHNGSDMHYL